MKKLFFACISLCIMTACGINKEAATETTNQLFSCIQGQKTALLNQIYPEPANHNKFQEFTKYTIGEIKSDDKGICVDVVLEYIAGRYEPASQKNVKVYLAENEEGGYNVCDSFGIFIFDQTSALYNYAIITGCLNELKDVSDVQIATKLNDAKQMRQQHFDKIKKELEDNITIERKTTVCYANVTHYEHVKLTNKTPYDIKGLKYRFTEGTNDYGNELVPTKVLKAGYWLAFQPYEYAVYNTDKTSFKLVIEDKVVWNIIKGLEYTGTEYEAYLAQKANATAAE